jgi:serine/threonine protein kinase
LFLGKGDLMIGQTISHYTITAKLGSGGMGEVYLAVDSKLDRKVALKFLPRQMSSQPDAKARFLQEARAASALNHPNICTIHDLQEADGQLFIVMEYVEGQTLRDRTQPFTLKQVVEIGIQVADGLAAAHEKGIVHRDIKTENLMMRKDGIVQIMDFGLAKLRGATRLTKEGSTVGTVGYMSPEEVQGLETDHRTDLFSLGVVLYELIAGQLPFKGAHETAIMYEIVNVDPQPLSAIRDDIDPELDRLILDCLQKDPNERCQSAREIARILRRFKIDSGRKHQSRVSTVRPSLSVSRAPVASDRMAARRGFERFKWLAIGAAAAAVVMLAAFFLLWRGNTGSSLPHTLRFTIPTPPDMTLNIPGGSKTAISPDGQRLLITAVDSNGTRRLWLRQMNALTAEPLSGTDGATHPFWAPDSRQAGFFADGRLKRIDVTGGSVLTLCDAPDGRGGTWNRDGIIVFAPNYLGGLSRVRASGGAPTIITHADSLRYLETHRWPYFLPDGNRFLYFVRTGAGPYSDSTGCVRVGSLDGRADRQVMRGVANTAFARDHIFFLRGNTLMAQQFDVREAVLSGDPFPVGERLFFAGDYSHADFSVSENGTLVYRAGWGDAGNRLLWYDRQGRILDTVGDPALYRDCRLSPDGQYLAVGLTADVSSRSSDVWVYDLNRNIRTRLTFPPGVNDSPVWSPDGSYVYFGSARSKMKSDLYWKPANGAGEERLLLTSDQDKYVTDCAPDGRHLVFYTVRAGGAGCDLWTAPLAEGGTKVASESMPFQQTGLGGGDARFSPDGRWLAYWSGAAQGQIYVCPFPGPGGKWQVSSEPGDYPCWRRDGKELFYLTENNILMAVDVDGTGSSFEAGRPRPLFQVQNVGSLSAISPYDVTADGQRFIVITGEAGQTSTINVVVNWDAELRAK